MNGRRSPGMYARHTRCPYLCSDCRGSGQNCGFPQGCVSSKTKKGPTTLKSSLMTDDISSLFDTYIFCFPPCGHDKLTDNDRALLHAEVFPPRSSTGKLIHSNVGDPTWVCPTFASHLRNMETSWLFSFSAPARFAPTTEYIKRARRQKTRAYHTARDNESDCAFNAVLLRSQ